MTASSANFGSDDRSSPRRAWLRSPLALLGGCELLAAVCVLGLTATGAVLFLKSDGSLSAVGLGADNPGDRQADGEATSAGTDWPVVLADSFEAAAASSSTWFDDLIKGFDLEGNPLEDQSLSTGDASGVWPVGAIADGLATGQQEIADGVYRWEFDAQRSMVHVAWPALSEVVDFDVAVDARRVSGPESDGYGIAFRHRGEDHYIFLISDEQRFRVDLQQSGQRRELIDWTRNDAIQPGKVNRLAVRAEDNGFSFSINGQLVDTLEAPEGEGLASGHVGLALMLEPSDGSAVYEFDNFELRVPASGTDPRPMALATALAAPDQDTASQWPVRSGDGFGSASAQSSDWWTGNNQDEYMEADVTISQGRYRWDIHSLRSNVAYRVGLETPAISDLYVTVDARRAAGPALSTYGLYFRQQGDSFYEFVVSDDGYFRLDLLYRGQWTELIGWTYTPAIQAGQDNRLTVMASGSNIFIFINEQHVAQAYDTHLASGSLGLVAAVYNQDDRGQFEFDNFEVRSPD